MTTRIINLRAQKRIAVLSALVVSVATSGCGQKGPLVKPAAKASRPAAAPVDPATISAPGISIPTPDTPTGNTPAGK